MEFCKYLGQSVLKFNDPQAIIQQIVSLIKR